MWQTHLRPGSLPEVLELLAEHTGRARLVAGGTDVLVELSRGILPAETLIDLTAIGPLRYVRSEGGEIRLGALATHNDVIRSAACVARALPLAQACVEVGAPQIRTRATIAGNLVTASPANDTITPLVALGARLVLASRAGERVVALDEFYRGVRKTVLEPGELVREIRVPALQSDQRGIFLKLGLRRAQAIAVVNVAVVLTLEGEWQRTGRGRAAGLPPSAFRRVREARIALGCVAPTIVRAHSAEAFLAGRDLDAATWEEAGRLASAESAPIDDIRGSAAYRRTMVAALVAEALRRLAEGSERAGWPSAPVLLETPARVAIASRAASVATPGQGGEGRASYRSEYRSGAGTPGGAGAIPPQAPPFAGTIETTINGERRGFASGAHRKTLLALLREDALLTGTKEGCAEGECGACTVWLNGQAVMSCLVPAAQAHGAEVTTIEGLAATNSSGEQGLHPLQAAFIASGAVQCGYCIPGMLMAGAKLLAEHPHPSREQAQLALSGNICRCTGYRKILDAVRVAGIAGG